MSVIEWLKREVVLAIHRSQLREHGGRDGIRDERLLDSALARPRNLHAYHTPDPDIPAFAAAYAFGIAKNHPFVDGNKRTAFVVCRTFLLLNGWDIEATKEDRYRIFMELASGTIGEDDLTRWIRGHCMPVEDAGPS